MCTKDMDEVLDILNFAPRDLWVAYKEFSLGSFYNDKAAEVRFYLGFLSFLGFLVFSGCLGTLGCSYIVWFIVL